ncbi:rho GTPase-activating protein 32 isoform X3 [Oryzias latipes]
MFYAWSKAWVWDHPKFVREAGDTKKLTFAEEQNEGPKVGLDSKELILLIQITCQGRSWLVRRSYEDFRVLDKHLHLCIYDRRYSQLTELPRQSTLTDTSELVAAMLAAYLSRFSAIADNKINCGPVLTWMEIDNKGNHLLVSEEASINVPAIAAAHVTKRYTAQATDELTFEVGDIVSVIDMPPKEDTGWWRGKHGFQVGFFPSDCVELINEKIPSSVQSTIPKPVFKKHGKLVTFLRSFMKSRPPPQKLRQRGILRERVFGCDLGEHLHNCEHEVPQVVKSCAEFIEKNGVVDGIYRLSGISSNIQKLRHEFDSEQIPDLSRDVFKQDIHSVGSLCKLYFRELPNPLLTYQLYDRFSEAVSAATDEERLVKIHNVIQQLPPPHYRTLEFLMRHLSRLATFSGITNMHTKNLAIVWAPNLLRSRQIESACFSGTAAFMEVRIQSVVVEFILNNTESLFSAKLNTIIRESTGKSTLSRPKSLMVCSPSTKLLSLEEAQARTQAQLGSPATTPCLTHSDYIEVGEGPEALLGKFHTVIELPVESTKRLPAKAKKSPVGNWLSFFHLGKSHSVSKRKLKRHPSEPNEIKSIALPGGRGHSGTLRSTKSEESLTSLQNLKGDRSSYRPLRPRSTSGAISPVSREDLHKTRRKDDIENPQLNEEQSDEDQTCTAGVSPPNMEDDLDLSPPATGISFLDFDPMSFQCSPQSVTPALQRNKDGSKWRRNAGCSNESEPVSSPNNLGSPHSPDVSPVLGKGGKKITAKQLSPKLKKKSFKMLADGQTASLAPEPNFSPQVDKTKPPVADGKESRVSFQRCSPHSSASQMSAMTDISQSAQNLPDPGTDRLMSSVSVLPPHPPLTSAARKLALALAESAQKAASGPQRKSNTPLHLIQRQEVHHPPRPSVLDVKGCPQEYCFPRKSPFSSWQSPSEVGCGPDPAHFQRLHLRSEPLNVSDSQESTCNFTPNVSPLGSGSFDEGSTEGREQRDDKESEEVTHGKHAYHSVGVSTPCQPVCPAWSPSASPIYANTDSVDAFNFRAVLAESSMPASIEEVFPRQLQTPSSHLYCLEGDRVLDVLTHHVDDAYSKHRPHLYHLPNYSGIIPESRCQRPNALPPHLTRPKGLYRQSSEGRYSTYGLRLPLSPQYRRFRKDEHLISGCHRQQGQWQRSEDRVVVNPAIRRARSFHAPHVSHYDLPDTEILHSDAMFYLEQTASQEAPYQRLIQTGLHSVRPQFNNTEFYYRPCTDGNFAEAQFCSGEPCLQTGAHHSQSYTVRSTRGGQSDHYNYSPHSVSPQNRKLYTESRDTNLYEAGDAEGLGVVHQPFKYESKSRHKNTYQVVSSYGSPGSPVDTRSRDIVHTRSKSDPGDASLLSNSRTETLNNVTSPTTSSVSKAEPKVQGNTHRSAVDSRPLRQIQIKQGSSQQQGLRKVPSLPEKGCLNLKTMERNDRSHSGGQDHDLLMVLNSSSGVMRPTILKRPRRSQSTREHHHYYHHHSKSPLDPDYRECCSAQPNRRTQSTKVRPTQYDHMGGYFAAPRHKPTRATKAGAGYLPGPSIHGRRLLSNVLGHEAFYRPPLRPEAGVYE